MKKILSEFVLLTSIQLWILIALGVQAFCRSDYETATMWLVAGIIVSRIDQLQGKLNERTRSH